MPLPTPTKSNVSYLDSSALTIPELLELGKALDEDLLRKTGIYQEVQSAEEEAYWRAEAASELLTPLKLSIEELTGFRNQFLNPERGSPRRVGGPPQRRGRSLPPAGSIIEVKHRYTSGSGHGTGIVKFRFLVMDPRGHLIILDGRSEKVIHQSPSSAASAATGNTAEKGWAFFGVS